MTRTDTIELDGFDYVDVQGCDGNEYEAILQDSGSTVKIKGRPELLLALARAIFKIVPDVEEAQAKAA